MKTIRQSLILPSRSLIAVIICILIFLGLLETSHSSNLDPAWNNDMILEQPIANLSVFQIDILTEYEKTKDDDIRARDAFILSQLWNEGLLKSEIKDYLIGKYYKLALIQSYINYNSPNWQVQCQQSFPFPSVWTTFTPTLYKNGQIEWAPTNPQKENAMSLNSSIIISQTGGVFQNGDTIYYTIKIQEKDGQEIVWEKTIKTNQVVLNGLQ